MRVAARLIMASVLALAAASGGLLATIHEWPADAAQSARREGALVVYSTTDNAEAAELLAAFGKAHPGIRVEYDSLAASEVFNRFKSESDAGHDRADIVMNSAMDLQVKLANDGYARTYASPEASALPDGAIWRNQLFAVSAEPIVIGYNPKLLPKQFVPASHDGLASLLHQRPDVFAGHIGSYDPMRSPTGHLYLTQDIQNDQDAWDLIVAIGRSRPKLYVSSQTMIEDVSTGRLALAYNIIGSYAFERAARDPNFKVIVPGDYALKMARVALIARDAPHPAAAEVFLDFLLSREGQLLLAKHHMSPVRSDLRGTAVTAGANIRAVKLDPALLATTDRMNFQRFRRKWLDALTQHEQARKDA